MYPRGDQLYPMRCVGLKEFWVEETRIIFPQHTSLQPSTLHPQKQLLHCTKQMSTLSFLLLQGQHLCSSSRTVLQEGGRLLPTQIASWQLRQELHWLGLGQTAQFSLLAFSFLSVARCWSVLNSHHHLLQEKILNTGGVNKMHISIHSYSDKGIIRQLVRISK